MGSLVPFNHLHCHTQFSLLDGAASISNLMKKAKEDKMRAVALTDHGNMFGAFKFVSEAEKNGLKPIVGCEFYVVENRHIHTFGKAKKDIRHHQLMLAKNAEGFRNLSKLCSLGFIEGYYNKYPRIDKELILQYHKGIIATSCCIGAEIPQAILKEGVERAEEKLKWWIDVFGEDYYIEIQRHGLENLDNTGISQEDINQILLGWAKKYNLKVIATNDSHYVEEDNANAHDILLCINTGEKQSTPVGDGKGYRFGFPNKEFYFKNQQQMNTLFADVPFALDHTNEIFDKVETLKLKRDILMPNFQIPTDFHTQDDFLRHLTFKGASKHYGSLTAEIEERLNFELEIIKKMGFPGYFLIVQDFINAGRDLGVWVGPGRGSAAGSAVAYCVGITNIDPIKYNLLFERFLNPERVSMPDIDIDFDDEGRQKVIDYVVDKYGKNQVAQIITYGTMAAKVAVKDVARVMELPLDVANQITKLIPDKPGTKLDEAFKNVPELKEILEKKDSLEARVLREALILEGSVRNRGVHAAGVIIAPNDITDYIPVCTSSETDLYITQFDGKVIEDAGMLKMDFLGLKTLTILRDAVALVEKNHQIKIDLDNIPLDDPKTFELYQRGDTVATFQFESAGMQMYLRQLKPTNIEDLIAMNALYRPGPMQFIPLYINRKNGKEPVEYPHELLEGILKPTYGIMVYQEQIMQTAQILAGYSLGGADLLRRAMGKKNAQEMDKQRAIFVAGAEKISNIPKAKANEIFDVMQKFAEYGFNRSHSAAYSVVAYQTAYVKANFPAEYMASVMTHNMGNIEKITFFLSEARKQGIEVLGPDINESENQFGVNKQGKIRFGLGAIKGTGDAAVGEIIRERNEKGNFEDVFDFVSRVSLQTVNKKTMESLTYSGGFDSFGINREQFLVKEGDMTFLEKLVKYGLAIQSDKNNAQNSLFGGGTDVLVPKPRIPSANNWTNIQKLKHEKDVIGFYLTGHPLDEYRLEMQFTTCSLTEAFNLKGKDVMIAGMVSAIREGTTAKGTPFMTFTIEDYDGEATFSLFGSDYPKFAPFVRPDTYLFINAKVDKSFRDPEKTELKVQKIQYLSEIGSDMVQGLLISIDLDAIDERLILDLNVLLENNKGKTPLKVKIVDKTEDIHLDFFSRRYNLDIKKEFLDDLSQMDGISYKVLSRNSHKAFA